MSLSKRITTIFISTIFICTTIVGTFSYMLERSEVIKANAERALAIARTVSTALESEQFSEIMTTLEPNEYYYDFKAILNGTIEKCDILYLYVVKVDGKEVTYFAEGFPRADSPDEPEAILGDTEDIDVYPDEMLESMNTGMEKMTGIYNLGGFGDMVSGYVPIKDNAGKVIGVIGVDLSIDDAMATANNFGFYMLLITLLLCTSSMIFIILFIKKYLSTPVREMTEAAGRLAVGDININMIKRNDDEIGQLTESFSNIINSTKEQSILIERLAGGDFTVDISPRCTEDTINNSLTKLCDNLNDMMSNIQVSMYQVSENSKQIEESAHSVAHGSSEQAASIEELTVNISQLTESTRHNADNAKFAANLSASVMENAEIGNTKMEQMLIAVKDINEASAHIEKVIKVIDDIAFQTNILALNAAVEAARAGQHGKGFAIVAEEVRNLASKSAEAAKDTDGLIKNSIEKANLGARIAEETSVSLKEIVAGITQNTQFVTEIAQTGAEQESAVNEMHKGLSLVSEVIQKNSASAQESASASEEMSNQAHVLEDMVSQYKVKNNI